LHKALSKIALQLHQHMQHSGKTERLRYNRKVAEVNRTLPPLPNFSRFHTAFRMPGHYDELPERQIPGDLRKAYFSAYNEKDCEYLLWDEIEHLLASGVPVVGATFIIPYPPGFPVVVPGQEISLNIVTFMKGLDVSEVHGFVPGVGVKVFQTKFIETLVLNQKVAVMDF